MACPRGHHAGCWTSGSTALNGYMFQMVNVEIDQLRLPEGQQNFQNSIQTCYLERIARNLFYLNTVYKHALAELYSTPDVGKSWLNSGKEHLASAAALQYNVVEKKKN